MRMHFQIVLYPLSRQSDRHRLTYQLDRGAKIGVGVVLSATPLKHSPHPGTKASHEGSPLLVMFFGCTYAALLAVILWPVEVWTSNVRTTGSPSSRERRVSRTLLYCSR